MMFYLRATVAIVLGAVGLVPLALAAGCWWLALKCWPGERAQQHAAGILAALRRPITPAPATQPPPEPVRLDLDRNDLGPLAPRRQPTPDESACAEAAAASVRTTIRVDATRAGYGPPADLTQRH